jgi:flagellar biosynthetic protein FliP
MKRIPLPILITLIFVALIFICPETSAQQLSGTPEEVGFKINLEGQSFSKAVNILLLMTALSLAPTAIMMMTSFTRIVIVLSFLKQAMATQSSPSAKIIASLALFLTIFIMQPVWSEMYNKAVVPYSNKQISDKVAFERGVKPLKGFMLKQTRDSSLLLFMDLASMEPVESPEDLPLSVIIPAFMVSELKTAFQMGFLIYLPFVLVDIVVATTLMSMGMMMLPPMMISLPFKLLLFIMVDGWSMVIRSLVGSFS